MKVFKRFTSSADSDDDPAVVAATNQWKKTRKQYAALADAMAHAARPLMEAAEKWENISVMLENCQMGQPANMLSLLQSSSEAEKRSAQSLLRYASLLETKIIPPIMHAFDESKSTFEEQKQAYKQAKKDLKSKLDKGAEEEDIRLLEETVSNCAKQLTKAIQDSLTSAGRILMQSLYTAFRAHLLCHQLSVDAYQQELSYVLR